MSNLDFIKFACNLKQYLSMKLDFIETNETFPVAMLDDIVLYFNHHADPEEAAYDWDRRKSRINYDNLYFILCYREGYPLDRVREIENAKCKGYALITHKPLGLPYEVFIKGNGSSQQNFLEKDKYGIMTIEKEWDFVSWLNGTEE